MNFSSDQLARLKFFFCFFCFSFSIFRHLTIWDVSLWKSSPLSSFFTPKTTVENEDENDYWLGFLRDIGRIFPFFNVYFLDVTFLSILGYFPNSLRPNEIFQHFRNVIRWALCNILADVIANNRLFSFILLFHTRSLFSSFFYFLFISYFFLFYFSNRIVQNLISTAFLCVRDFANLNTAHALTLSLVHPIILPLYSNSLYLETLDLQILRQLCLLFQCTPPSWRYSV